MNTNPGQRLECITSLVIGFRRYDEQIATQRKSAGRYNDIPNQAGSGRGLFLMRRIIIIVFALIVFGIVLALALENLQSIQFNYLFGAVSLPLAAVLAGVLVIGAIFGAFTAIPAVLRAHWHARRYRGQLHRAREEIDNLRRAPLRDAN
jgi:uncharacterized integral membrane protein